MWNETLGVKIFKVFNYIFMALFAFATFYPFWYVLVASFNTGRDFMRGGVYFWPRDFTLENYAEAFQDSQIYTSLGISVARTLLGVVLGIFFTALVAYALTVKTMPGRTFFTFFFYITTIISGGMIPYYMLLRDLGLTRSFWLYILPSIFSFFNVVLMRTNFSTIPAELREAAMLDGAGHARVLFQVYLPISMPVIATLILFIGVGHWNDWYTGAYYMSDESLIPAATLLQKLLTQSTAGQNFEIGREQMLEGLKSTTSQSLQMAFVMLLTMPIVVVYPFLQKYYVKGVMVGSVKG